MIIPLLSILPSIPDSESLNLKQLARASTTVVIGEVLTQRAEVDSNGISTYVTIIVNDTLKGRDREVIDVRVPGGSFGDLEVIVPGTPKFINDTEVLLFLNGSTIVGVDDGAMIIEGGRAWRAANSKEFTLPHLLFPSLDILDSSYYFDSWDLEDVRYVVSRKN
jgi:hypothetical protein